MFTIAVPLWRNLGCDLSCYGPPRMGLQGDGSMRREGAHGRAPSRFTTRPATSKGLDQAGMPGGDDRARGDVEQEHAQVVGPQHNDVGVLAGCQAADAGTESAGADSVD